MIYDNNNNNKHKNKNNNNNNDNCGVIFAAAQSAALAPRKEVLTLIADSRSRPADVYLPCWKHGRPAAIDVTVISPVQQLTVGRAAVFLGHALEGTESPLS